MALRHTSMNRPLPWAAALAFASSAGSAIAQEEELANGVTAYNSGHYETAAGEFYQVVESGQDAVNRQKAEYYLAQSFYKMKLYQPAFQYYGLIVKQGARHRYYFKAIAGLVNVAEALHDGAIIPSVLNRSYGSDFERLPEKTLNKVNYLVGMLSYRANKTDEANEFLSAVPKKSSYYARARYLYGLALVQKSPKDAIKLFKEVMALPVDPAKYYDIDNVRELHPARARPHLLRHGALRQLRDLVRRRSRASRTTGTRRSSRTAGRSSRTARPARALGSLEALHAPQFAGAFAPESWILKATIYFFNCLYPETKGAISGFRRIYLPYNEQIKTVLAGDHDFDYFAKLIQKPEGELPLAVVNYLIGNQRVFGFKEYLDELATEKERVEGISSWKEGGLGPEVSQLIDTQEQTLVKLTGKFVQGRLKYAQKTIEGFDSQAEIILFETLKAEKELIEKGVDSSARLASQELWRAKVPDPTWDYWAFEGEFWIDEIGYYEYTLKNGCALRQEKSLMERSEDLRDPARPGPGPGFAGGSSGRRRNRGRAPGRGREQEEEEAGQEGRHQGRDQLVQLGWRGRRAREAGGPRHLEHQVGREGEKVPDRPRQVPDEQAQRRPARHEGGREAQRGDRGAQEDHPQDPGRLAAEGRPPLPALPSSGGRRASSSTSPRMADYEAVYQKYTEQNKPA